jgi:hypothetical protein
MLPGNDEGAASAVQVLRRLYRLSPETRLVKSRTSRSVSFRVLRYSSLDVRRQRVPLAEASLAHLKTASGAEKTGGERPPSAPWPPI